MRLLTFQAEHFAWRSFSKTLADVDDVDVNEAVDDALVVFMHIEQGDFAADSKAFKHTLKHVKWLANKRDLKTVVLHSFAHLGGENAEPSQALDFMHRLKARLESTNYTVQLTPFGYFCSWDLRVYGDSLAKVYKAL
ncbi:MAG: threonyl-tRNA synthetase editing domain-containing protein [Myxococcota bacterium]